MMGDFCQVKCNTATNNNCLGDTQKTIKNLRGIALKSQNLLTLGEAIKPILPLKNQSTQPTEFPHYLLLFYLYIL